MKEMKMTFRWYGMDDPVSLEYISQIPGMTGIVSAVYDVPPGKEWSTESINAVKNAANAHNLAFEVVESVPVHEDIKLGKPFPKIVQRNVPKTFRMSPGIFCRCPCIKEYHIFTAPQICYVLIVKLLHQTVRNVLRHKARHIHRIFCRGIWRSICKVKIF